MNIEAALCPYCRGTGLERNRILPRPADHAARGHAPPISGRSGCGCMWVACSANHVIAEIPLRMVDGSRAVGTSYLDPASVAAMGWLIQTTEENE